MDFSEPFSLYSGAIRLGLTERLNILERETVRIYQKKLNMTVREEVVVEETSESSVSIEEIIEEEKEEVIVEKAEVVKVEVDYPDLRGRVMELEDELATMKDNVEREYREQLLTL